MCQKSPNFTDFTKFSQGNMLPDPLPACLCCSATLSSQRSMLWNFLTIKLVSFSCPLVWTCALVPQKNPSSVTQVWLITLLMCGSRGGGCRPPTPLENHKVSKGAKIRNQYNQVPNLTQDTNRKVTNSQLDTTNESQEVSPFPAGDHKAHINRPAQKHSKQKTEKTLKDPQKEYPLEWSVKYFTGELKPVSRRQPHP